MGLQLIADLLIATIKEAISPPLVTLQVKQIALLIHLQLGPN